MTDKYPVENEDLKEIILFFRDCALGEFDGTNVYGNEVPEEVGKLLEKLENMKGMKLYFKILEKEKDDALLPYMSSIHAFLEKYDSKWDKEVLGEKYRALAKKYPKVNKTAPN